MAGSKEISDKGSKPVSMQERKKFYWQELFNGFRAMRKYFVLIALTIEIEEMIKTALYTLNDESNIDTTLHFIIHGVAIVAILVYGIIYWKKTKRKQVRPYKIQLGIILVGNVFAFVVPIVFITTFFRNIENNGGNIISKETFYDGIGLFLSSIYATLLVDIINPIWYMKALLPVGYIIAFIVGSYQINAELPAQCWFIFATSVFNILLLTWLKSYFRWRQFLRRSEQENWNEVHKLILHKVPCPLAVFDTSGNVVYSNGEFNKLSQENIKIFSKRIVKLKSRKSHNSNNDSYVYQKSNVGLGPSVSMNNEKFKMLFESTKSSPFYNEDDIMEENKDLTELIHKAGQLLEEGKILDGTQFVFDGKLNDEDDDSVSYSFEVTLSFMTEHQKMIAILKNTTEHARIVALETNNQYKDKLLASVSHELRTPLNGNLSFIKAALNHSEVPQIIKEQLLLPAYRSGKLLSHLINDILDYSQIGVRRLRLNFEELSVFDTMKKCFQLFELQAKRKGVELELSIDDEVPEFFWTDHDRLGQVILNLLSNALKFTFKGKIELKVSMPALNQLKFTVEDTGIGLTEEDMTRLFKEFAKNGNGADSPTNAGSKGVGLGLKIANQLAKYLGPDNEDAGLKVESVYEKGSTFSFLVVEKTRENSLYKNSPSGAIYYSSQSFKLRPEPSFQPSRSIAASSIQSMDNNEGTAFRPLSGYLDVAKINSILKPKIKNSLQNMLIKQTSRQTTSRIVINGVPDKLFTKRKKRILIVDDDLFNILALETFLKEYEVEIDSAYNGKDAVEKVTEVYKDDKENAPKHYSLIIMDCQMPIMDGYEATRALIRMMNQDLIPEIPVVGCTAFEQGQHTDSCFDAGMTEVIKKPLSKSKVQQLINDYMLD